MNHVRRSASILALAVLLVAAVLIGQSGLVGPLGHSVGSAHSAAACTPGWTQTNYVSAVATDPLGQQAATDIVAFTDNCGLRQYKYSVWSPTGSSLSNVSIGWRVWACGNLVQQGHSFGDPVWTGWISYGSCGPQTDNASPLGGTTANTSAAAYNSNNFGVFYDHI